ncbi:MAG: thioredoxin family protein [Candidatus Thorarchaeota archaeon]
MTDVQMNATLNDIQDNSLSCIEYIEAMPSSSREGFMRNMMMYNLNEEAVQKLSAIANDYEFVVIFADWCGDARHAVPVLALLEQKIEIKIRSLGGMEKPEWGSSELWAVPPSPPEVKTFDITSSPTILIFEKNSGREIGRIKTRPRITSSIEEELVELVERTCN